jgi:pilus assembly protein CpaE
MSERSSRSSPIAPRRNAPPSLTPEDPPESRAKSGIVIAVFGARANVGVTTVAASLAQAFRLLGEHDVALAEIDPRAVRARSQAAAARHRKPGRIRSPAREETLSINTADSADRLTLPGASAALVREPDGVWKLAMTRPRATATGDAKGVTGALEAIRERFPVSVAELEHQVNERTLAAFDAADRILLVTEGSVPSLRATQRVLRLCRRLNYPDEKMCVILNRYDAPGSLDVADVSAALKRELFWKIPDSAGAAMTGLAEKLLTE